MRILYSCQLLQCIALPDIRVTALHRALFASFLLSVGFSPLRAQLSTAHLDPVRQPAPLQNLPALRRYSQRTALESVSLPGSKSADSTRPFDQWLSLLAGADATAVTTDAAGHIYVVGGTFTGLPVTSNGFQRAYPADFGDITGFLLELDSEGSQVLYGTYLNGLVPEQVVVDQTGYVYVLANHIEQNAEYTAVTYPAPITSNAVQAYPGTGITPTLLKISPSGELVYATFLGGVIALTGGALAVDSKGSAVVCGSTADPNLPASPSAVQTHLQGVYNVFAARLSPDGSAYEALTFLGGEGADRCAGLQLDAEGNIYLFGDTNSRFFPVTPGAYQTSRGGGIDLFVTKMDSSMQELLWSTYVGGSWDTVAQPTVNGISPGYQSSALAADGSVVFTGNTAAFDYPVSPDTAPPPYPGSYKPVLGVIDPSGSRLTFSSPVPLSGLVDSIVTGDGHTFFVLGTAAVSDIAANATLNAQGLDGFLDLGGEYSYPFLARVDLISRSLTYLGPLREINGLNGLPAIGSCVARNGSLIIASLALDSYSSPLPPAKSIGGIANPGYGTVIFDLNFSSEKEPLITALLNPASLLASPLTPGQIIEVRGMGLGGSSPVTASNPGNLPSELAGIQLMIDGTPVPLLSVDDGSIVALAPTGDFSSETSVISVKSGDVQSDPRTVPTALVNPAIFTTLWIGVGQAVAINADGSTNSSQNPVRKGEVIRLVTTGLGAVTGGSTPRPQASITATIAGLSADVRSVAPVAGYPAGYFAVSALVPSGVPEGDFIPVVVAADGTSSQTGVTISIR